MMETKMPFRLAIDYDGTLFQGSWPQKGAPKWDIIDKVKEFKEHGAEIILWTCREDKSLKEAVERCKEVGLEFDAINENSKSQKEYLESKAAQGEIFATRKIFADFYVGDDAMNLQIFLSINVPETCQRFERR